MSLDHVWVESQPLSRSAQGVECSLLRCSRRPPLPLTVTVSLVRSLALLGRPTGALSPHEGALLFPPGFLLLFRTSCRTFTPALILCRPLLCSKGAFPQALALDLRLALCGREGGVPLPVSHPLRFADRLALLRSKVRTPLPHLGCLDSLLLGCARPSLWWASHTTSLPENLPPSQTTSSVMTMVAVMHHLMGAAEIGARLGVSRQRVQQIVSRPDFPDPEAVLGMGKVWLAEDVERWIQEHRSGT